MLRVKWEEMSEILCLPKMDAAKSLGMGPGQVSIRKKKMGGGGGGGYSGSSGASMHGCIIINLLEFFCCVKIESD